MKRLLALDGGGIKGIISLQILKVIEEQVRRELDKAEAVIADYFHYIGGTSTGSLTAAGLAMGMSVDELIGLYRNIKRIFKKRKILNRFLSKYDSQGLKELLLEIFSEEDGSEMRLGSPRLKTLLLIVTRNATTGSPWPLTNNPEAQFNQKGIAGCNLDYPLWQILSASCAAPTYFQAERVPVAGMVSESIIERECFFEDGGITPYNNPAYLLFLKATLPEYRLCWKTGFDQLCLVSVGTGKLPVGMEVRKHPNILQQVANVPASLIRSFQDHQDLLCRLHGQCVFGAELDTELGNLQRGHPDPKFRYVRYDPVLGSREIQESRKYSKSHIALDNTDLIDFLASIGADYAAKSVRFSDWNG